MADLDALISARSSFSNASEKYKDIASQLEREIDPLEAAARLEAASILSLDGVKQFSIEFDAPLRADEGDEDNIDELKVRRLIELHDELEIPQIVVYVPSQKETDKLKADLKEKGKHITVVTIDVGMLDRARDAVRLRFQGGFDNILIVNDSVPNHRGIEFTCFEKQTILVINYSLPHSVPLYSKRIGRRIPNFSRKGVAINFLSSSEKDHEMVRKCESFYNSTVKPLDNNPLAWKELRYFLRFCP
jgi:superfamily II DNA/RNA helicase